MCSTRATGRGAGTFSDRRTRIDLLLTDIVMPQLDGIHLVEQVFQTRPQMRVLYMSGKCDVETRAAAHARKGL